MTTHESMKAYKAKLGIAPDSKKEWIMTWQEVHNACRAMVQNIKDAKFEPTTIIAVAKGGIIPAGLVLQSFPEAHFIVLRAQSYDGQQQGDVQLLNPEVLTFVDFHKALVVDDILDSGRTFDAIDKLFPMIRYASMLRRNSQQAKFQRYNGWLVPDESWVVFPWEQG